MLPDDLSTAAPRSRRRPQGQTAIPSRPLQRATLEGMIPSTTTLPGLFVFLPYHVGFHLDESLVVVALQDARIDLVERVDLPRDAPLDDLTTARLLSALRRRCPTSVLVVAYADARDPSRAMTAFLSDLRSVAPVEMAAVVRGGRWAPWTMPDPLKDGPSSPAAWHPATWPSPPGWHDLPHPADVPLVAEFVGCGVAPFASREALARALEHTPDPHLAARISQWGHPRVSAGLRAWDRLLGGSEAPGDDALALALLSQVAGRDALLMELVPVAAGRHGRGAGRRRGIRLDGDGLGSWSEDEDAVVFDDEVGERAAVIGPGTTDPTEEGARVRAVLMRLARIAPEHLRPAVLSTLAVWAWNVGDGAVAAIAVELALEADPDYSLAGLVAQLVQNDVRPPAA